jgi:hypothetical protein
MKTSRALFAVYPEPIELWEISDAAHTDFERHDPQTWRRRVLGFLARHLDAANP